MRRQVIALTTALLVSLTAATTPAWAGGDANGWGHHVTPGAGGHDIGADVWKNGGTGKGRTGHDSTSVDGQTPADAGKALNNRKSQLVYQCTQIASSLTTAANAPAGKNKNTALADLMAQFNKGCTGLTMNGGKPVATNVAPRPDPAYLGRRAVLYLDLPGARPVISPAPAVNKWKMTAVGYPLWLSVTDPRSQVSTSITVEGYQVSLKATRSAVHFSMGDGNSVSCASTTAWSRSVKAGTTSPTCGYRYQEPSAPGSYKVTATTGWEVTWSVMGASGTVGIDKAGGVQLPVGELQSVVVR